METLHISNLNDQISLTLSTNFPNYLTLIGEVITIKPSGKNYYITIKDINKDSQINCTLWGRDTDVKQGDRVEILGKIAVNSKNVSLYINIKSIKKVDDGNIMAGFDKLRQELIHLDYDKNKRELLKFPQNIGIITAKEGAAIQDILQTFKLDNFTGNIKIFNAVVQGKQCPSSVISGIDYFIENQDIDVLLITRGGGSFDDLVGFSDRSLLDKIFYSKHLHNFVTISAVGHQIDNQLTDLVCDYYFATPSIAAKFIVEKQKSYMAKLESYQSLYSTIYSKYEDIICEFRKIDLENAKKYYYSKKAKDDFMHLQRFKSLYENKMHLLTKCKDRIQKFIRKIQPDIYNGKNSKVLSIYHFIDKETSKPISPKKLLFNFVDGNLEVSYKIVNYEIL